MPHKPRTAEHNAKISAAMKGKKKNPEHKAKIAESRRRAWKENPNPPWAKKHYPPPPGAEGYIEEHVPKHTDGTPMLVWNEHGKLRYTRSSIGLPADYSVPQEYRTTPETKVMKGPICGSPNRNKTHSGPICCKPAGWGTEHPGVGPCRYHGGTLPDVNKHYIKILEKKKMATYGQPIKVDPHTAVLSMVHTAAGHVQWLLDKIQALSEIEGDMTLHQYTSMGIKASVWVEMYERERMMLLRASKSAVDMGVSERQVQLAEEQGRMIAGVLQKFIDSQEIGLTAQQRIVAPKVIRELLTSMPQVATEGTIVRPDPTTEKSSNLASRPVSKALDPPVTDDEDWEEF